MKKTPSNLAPNFMIIGAAKAGTTTLYDDLARHPDAALPSIKEPDILHQGETLEDCAALYSRHFAEAPLDKLRGEGSTYYTMQPKHGNVAHRAKALCGPDLKLIYMMRDPIARIKSHLGHAYASGTGIDGTDFEAAVLNDPLYRTLSDYPMQLESWLAEFNPEQILCIWFETFISQREETMRTVCEHIGLDPEKISVGQQVCNAKGSQRQHRFEILGKFLRSEFYRYRLRPLIPSGLKEVGKAKLMHKRAPEEVKLSLEVEQSLRDYFSDQNEKLEALGIKVYPAPTALG